MNIKLLIDIIELITLFTVVILIIDYELDHDYAIEVKQVNFEDVYNQKDILLRFIDWVERLINGVDKDV